MTAPAPPTPANEPAASADPTPANEPGHGPGGAAGGPEHVPLSDDEKRALADRAAERFADPAYRQRLDAAPAPLTPTEVTCASCGRKYESSEAPAMAHLCADCTGWSCPLTIVVEP